MSLDYYNLSDQSIEKTVQYLKHELGLFHFRWLCACAVYPVLRLPLTAYLGKELAKIDGRSIPDEDEHLPLIRLPWFREGMMPDEVRLALLRQMSKEDRQKIRSLIEKLMKNPATAPSDSGEPVVLDWWVPAKKDLRSVFGQLLKGKKGRSEQEDAIFVQYMMGDVPGRLDMKLNNVLARYLNIRLRGWVDLRTVAAFSLMAITCVGLWFSSHFLTSTLQRVEASYQAPIPQMVRLPGGTFTMGSPENEKGRFSNEGPQHQVTVQPFAVGKYEVTFEQWDACVDDGGCNGYRPGDRGWGRGRRPVINVSWNDAQAYVTWLSRRTGREYRLLTEAEWEYAARGGTQTRYSFGDKDEDFCQYGNGYDQSETFGFGDKLKCSDGSGDKTMSVGSYKPNPFGLYDVHGNAWEWVQDHYHQNYDGAPADGSVWLSSSANKVGGRVLRGGSWNDEPRVLRSAFRNYFRPTSRVNDVGFRISRTSFTP